VEVEEEVQEEVAVEVGRLQVQEVGVEVLLQVQAVEEVVEVLPLVEEDDS